MGLRTADHLGGIASAGGYEPQRTNNGTLRISGLPGSGPDIIELALQSFPFPKFNLNPVEVNFHNSVRTFPTRITYEYGSLVIRDICNQDVAKTLWQWFKLGGDPETEKIGMSASFKKEADAIWFAPDDSIERTWKMVGCWLSAFDPGDMDNSGADIVVINTTLQYDKAYPEGW